MAHISKSYDDKFRRKDDWKDHDKKDEKKAQCFIDTHTINTQFNIAATASNQIIYRDVTHNHNKTLIEVASAQSPTGTAPVPFTITITTRGKRGCDKQIVEPIPAGQRRVIQVKDFKSLAVTNNGGATGNLLVYSQKTFCICCEDEKDMKHDKNCDCDCD